MSATSIIINVGDIVITPKGFGIVVSRPNDAIAWVHLDGASKGHEIGFPINKLGKFEMTEQATKHDQDKYDPTMLSLEMIELVSRVRMFGAKKYSRGNWKKGFKITRSLAASLRHIISFMNGEDNDSESGLCHLGHAICCLEHAIYDFKHRPENDDRRE